MKMSIIAAAVIAGCVNGGGEIHADPQTDGKVRFLCVGMEHSVRFGDCLGCKKDAERLSSLMRDGYGYPGTTLISGEATKESFLRYLKEGIANTPEDGLFLLFYSGHGGQEYLGGAEPGMAEGVDDKDEYLCLYDAHVVDDQIWRIVSECKGRVFLYFDACHSATMFRSVSSDMNVKARALGLYGETNLVKSSGFTFRPRSLRKARALDAGAPSPRMLCWSGCRDMEASYGGRNGGYLTISVINSWRKGRSYGDVWKAAVKSVQDSEPNQNPVQTLIGGGFSDSMEAFR